MTNSPDKTVPADEHPRQSPHVLITTQTCNHADEDASCPVCDGGLAICSICGKAEVELDSPCVPRQSPRDAPERIWLCPQNYEAATACGHPSDTEYIRIDSQREAAYQAVVKALQRIRDAYESDCDCEHDTEYCCAKSNLMNEQCAKCFSAVVLDSLEGKERK
jgi:hypothetical protein